jgi:hypothetical protein
VSSSFRLVLITSVNITNKLGRDEPQSDKSKVIACASSSIKITQTHSNHNMQNSRLIHYQY